MRRFLTSLTPQQHERLKAISERTGASMASVIRDALSGHLGDREDGGDVGTGRDERGPEDGADDPTEGVDFRSLDAASLDLSDDRGEPLGDPQGNDPPGNGGDSSGDAPGGNDGTHTQTTKRQWWK